MKRIVAFLIALSVVMLSVPVFADTAEKFKGGMKDVITSPLQVSDHVKAETDKAKFLPFGMIGGFLKGSFYMAKQLVTGTVDVLTSPLEVIRK